MGVPFQHAVVVGASSGMGAALARQLAADGARVALVARQRAALEDVAADIERDNGVGAAVVVEHDVCDVAEVPELVQRVATELGGLDLVVYVAGCMHRMTVDEYDAAKGLEMVAVNLGGAVAWLEPIAERFARLGRGTIVGIGSVAGDRGRCGNPIYNASKAGLHTYLEGLRNRVARFGVRVVTIKPGFVDTAMTRGLPGLFWLISADRAARTILCKARRGTVTAYVPARWRLVMWVIRSIPSFLFRRLKV